MSYVVARASLRDTLAILSQVVVPTVAKGLLIRRRSMVALGAALDLDGRALALLCRLRERYGAGLLLLRWVGREQAVLLEPEAVRDVLHRTPVPFTAASSEKRAALAHFEPHAVLATPGPERAERRRFNEAVLDSDCPVHALAPALLRVVDQEVAAMMIAAAPSGTLDWDRFARGWARLSRRIVLGDGAADDEALSRDLSALRYDANWSFLKPRRTRIRARFLGRVQAYLDRADPGSLAARIAATPHCPRTEPAHQVPQWLFAFDAAAMATFRALAMLALHPEAERRARSELETAPDRTELPYLRACLLDSLRLWPTTPIIFRQAMRPADWGNATLPARTDLLIWAKLLHRDPARLPYADCFAPEIWLRGPDGINAMLVPFSDGPAVCPALNLVQLIGSAALAALLDAGKLSLERPRDLLPSRLPASLDPFAIRFRMR